MDELLTDFIAETRETLEAISGEIVAWEAHPGDRARLDSIFRFVHTVKGSCGFLDLPRLERLSHSAEEVLAQVRDGARVPDANLVSAVLSVIDRIGELVDAIETGVSLGDEDDQRLISALEEREQSIPAAIAAVQTADAPRAVARSIRLPIELLDRMMAGVSDLVLARNELSRRIRDHGADGAVDNAFERLSSCIADMRDAITRTRMQRIENLFSALPRMVRDLSAELGKTVALHIDGGDVELDREMVEMIRDPLTHIVRNAIDHGIEPPAERRAAGKSAAGSLRISARQAGNQILIEVADDGRGIDGDRLVAKAIAAGILDPDTAAGLSWARKIALIFEAGLSTANAVTAISGRGVGMDVVRANIERIGGLVDIDSRPRTGLRLTMRVPLTLTIIPALTVKVAGRRFAVPRSAIEEIVRVGRGGVRIERPGGAAIASIRDRRMPVVECEKLIGAPATEDGDRILVVLKPAGGDVFALSVDGVLDHEELVVKPAAPAVMAAGIYAGTTLPDNGRPMLLLDPAGLANAAGVLNEQVAPADIVDASEIDDRDVAVPTLLFRDLDGVERAVRLAVVERIEDVATDAVKLSAERLRLAHDGAIMPLLCAAEKFDGPRLRILRMGDGQQTFAYAIASVIDIVEMGRCDVPATKIGPVAGVALVDGRQVELLDPHWLFAAAAGPAQPIERPLVLLGDGKDNWTREVLRPLIEAAGYRTAFTGEGRSGAAAIIMTGDGGGDPTETDTPVIRLRATPDAGDGVASIYRYDREGLIAGLRHAIGGA